MVGHLLHDLAGRATIYSLSGWVLIMSAPVVWSHNHRKTHESFSKPFNTITLHPTQPVQVAKYGLHELSGEEERIIILNSIIVPLNTITKTAKILPCIENLTIYSQWLNPTLHMPYIRSLQKGFRVLSRQTRSSQLNTGFPHHT